MTIGDWLKKAEKKLVKADIGTARLDALVLLEDATAKDRAWLLAHPEFELTAEQLTRLEDMVIMRALHEPLAYVRRKVEFYGREFYIDPRVLVPRPESETMIELLVKLKPAPVQIVDVGTGSGCLAVSAKINFPRAKVVATDNDPLCLEVAKLNAEKFYTNIEFLEGDLLEPVVERGFKPEVIIANLPYVPDKYQVNQAAKNEPANAIFGGKDGLDVYRKLIKQIKPLDFQPVYILTESLPFQHEQLANEFKSVGYQLQQTEDFIQVFSHI